MAARELCTLSDESSRVSLPLQVKKLLSVPGGYSDVQLATLKGDEAACVVFEYSTCTIKVACVDAAHLLPGRASGLGASAGSVLHVL